MTTTVQLDHSLSKIAQYRGAFASNDMPNLNTLPWGDNSFIVNVSPDNILSKGHWLAFLHIKNRSQPPAIFDPIQSRLQAQNPDKDAHILGVPKTHFEDYAKKASELAGFGGHFYQSTVSLEDVYGSDICGDLSAIAIRENNLPNYPNGNIRPQWQDIVSARRNMSKRNYENFIIRRARVRNFRNTTTY